MSKFSSKELWNAWLVLQDRRSTALAVRELVAVYGYRAREAVTLVVTAKSKHGK